MSLVRSVDKKRKQNACQYHLSSLFQKIRNCIDNNNKVLRDPNGLKTPSLWYNFAIFSVNGRYTNIIIFIITFQSHQIIRQQFTYLTPTRRPNQEYQNTIRISYYPISPSENGSNESNPRFPSVRRLGHTYQRTLARGHQTHRRRWPPARLRLPGWRQQCP